MTNQQPISKQQFVKMALEFQHIFKVPLIKFTDKVLTKLLGQFVFDIIEFDNYAHEIWEYNEESHGSLQDFITKKFSKRAAELVDDLISNDIKF